MTTKQDNKKEFPYINPEGKGGFGDHPEHRSNGAWTKTETFRYWFEIFKIMSVTALKNWQKDNPEDIRSVASDLAFTRVINAKGNLKEYKVVEDRTEGRAPQEIKHTGRIENILDIPESTINAIKQGFREAIKNNRPETDREGSAGR